MSPGAVLQSVVCLENPCESVFNRLPDYVRADFFCIIARRASLESKSPISHQAGELIAALRGNCGWSEYDSEAWQRIDLTGVRVPKIKKITTGKTVEYAIVIVAPMNEQNTDMEVSLGWWGVGEQRREERRPNRFEVVIGEKEFDPNVRAWFKARLSDTPESKRQKEMEELALLFSLPPRTNQ